MKITNSKSRKRNKITCSLGICVMELCNRKGEIKAKTIFNVQHKSRVEKHNWNIMSIGYAVTTINKKYICLHRFIMRPPKNFEVDHLNHDKLDNRDINLKNLTHSHNLLNNRARGVIWSSKLNKWRAYARGKHIGCFKKLEDALLARRKMISEYLNENTSFSKTR